jgi:hypothetical protein
MVTNSTQMRNGKPGKSGKRGKAAADAQSDVTTTGSAAILHERDGADNGSANGSGAAAGPAEATSTPSDLERTPAKVGTGTAGRQILAIADLSESLDVRRRLRRLARQIERRSRDMQHMTLIEGAISDCLDDAAASTADRERWLLCEAATWGLAWMARTRRAGGSAGGLLERLVKSARSAQTPLAAGDTLAARFVLAMSRLFRDIEACRCLDHDAASSLAEEIRRLVSAEGTIRLRGSAAMVERVVRWSGARDIGLATGALPWDDSTEQLFSQAVATTLRLLGGQGRLLVGAGRMPAAFSDPLLAVGVASGRKRVRRTAEAVQGATQRRPSGGRKKMAAAQERLLPRDVHDAAAATAIIRSGWERNAIRLLIDYRDEVPHLEIAVGDRLLIEGPWQWRGSKNGRPLEMTGPWSLSCWESDKKATYLEIVAPLAGGLQIDRQVVLLPRDRVVLLADAITHRPGDRPGDSGDDVPGELLPQPLQGHANGGLRIESVVPLAATLEGEQAGETREILVFDTKPRLMALPLPMSEWKTAGRGSFAVTPDGLALEHQTAGSRCYAPLWLDLEPKRQGRPLTWRQLTVADTRQNLPPQQAVGFRVQQGLEQWLVYRTLDEPRNRSVLGCNISCGFLMGRIGRTGVVDRNIEIH